MLELVTGADVVISTLGSPSNSVLIMKTAAETLVKVLSEMDNPPRSVEKFNLNKYPKNTSF